jgi:hypothetical protein
MTTIRAGEEDGGLGWIHLYRQERPHGPALIRGNRKALELLRAAIDEALSDTKTATAEVVARDGESYRIQIERHGILGDIGQPPYADVRHLSSR